MNEELKIIINAVTNTAQKNIKQVKGEIEKLSKSGKASSSKFGAALGAIGTAAKTALKVTTTAVAAVATALIALGKST
ncbi:MAG: hypothetical protein IJ516_06765 [Phascolarctobacterium sp.]|nr:hypothetical protein [Phascolarctobacterium sp.]